MPFNIPKPAPGYTVDTGNAKMPTHLWMLDEPSGTACLDQGLAPGGLLQAALTNALMRSSDPQLGAAINVSLSPSYVAYTPDGVVWDSATQDLLLVCMMKSAVLSSPALTEAWFGMASSSLANVGARIRNPGIAGNDVAQADMHSDAGATPDVNSSADIYDQQWHFVAAKFRIGTSVIACAISVDGNPWTNDVATTIGAVTSTRYGIGCRPGPAITQQCVGQILAAYSYEKPAGAFNTWDDAWIADLFANPWQFLSTGPSIATKLHVEIHPDALGDTGISGVVFSNPTAPALTGDKIGEFTGAAFSGVLVNGLAVIEVPVADFGGDYLTAGTPLVVVLEDATQTTGIVAATVVEA